MFNSISNFIKNQKLIFRQLINEIINSKGKDEAQPWYDLYENVSPHIDYPECTMYELMNKTVNKYPLNYAYSYYGKNVRYYKFNEQVVQMAKGLKELGVKKGSRVTICMPNTPEAIITIYAVNMVGAVSNIIHPLSSEKGIEFYLNKSNSEYMLCLDMVYPKVKKIIENTSLKKVIISKVNGGMPLYMKVLYLLTQKQTNVEYNDMFIKYKNVYKMGKKSKEIIKQNRRSNDDAIILYSGGTTGDPKGVVLSNMNINALALQSFKMTDPAKVGDSVLTIMPIFHGFGIGVCVHTCIANGMKTILIPAFKPKDFSKIIKKNKPSFLAGVPTMYEALINSKEKSTTYLKSVHTVISGGDVLNEVLRDKVNTYLKAHGSEAVIRVGYGLSESTAASCLTPRYYYKEGGIGIPFPDTLYKIVKINTFEKADIDEIGEICINGPTVMSRYLDDYDETNKVLKVHEDGRLWLHTGDLGYMTKDGLVFFKSRLKRMIVSSGYNIYPQYLEKVIQSHPAVETCTVVGIPHPYKQQVPKAFIILRENFDLTSDLKDDIKEFCEKRIAKYELPYEYEYVDELPKTLVGKVAFTELMKKGSKNGKRKQ